MESLDINLKVKKCFKCLKELPICEYYKHNTNSDGYLNKCKICTKKDVRQREKKLRENNHDWVEKERNRHKENYIRLNCVWLEIKGFSNYLISDTGLVKNKKTNRILKLYLNKQGYYRLSMVGDDNKQKKPYLHRLLALSFIENDDIVNKTHVDHIDRNPLNNEISNLRWVTPKENIDNRGEFNKTGLYFDEIEKKWCVQKKDKNQLVKLGCFNNLTEAVVELTKNV